MIFEKKKTLRKVKLIRKKTVQMISGEIECVYAKLMLKSIRYIYTFIAPQKWFKYSLAVRI